MVTPCCRTGHHLGGSPSPDPAFDSFTLPRFLRGPDNECDPSRDARNIPASAALSIFSVHSSETDLAEWRLKIPRTVAPKYPVLEPTRLLSRIFRRACACRCDELPVAGKNTLKIVFFFFNSFASSAFCSELTLRQPYDLHLLARR